MEEDKAAALYESLSRQGLGAARFKQGLGFGGGASGAELTAGPISFKKAGADFSSEIKNAEHSRKEEDGKIPARRNRHESARVVQSIADKLRGKRSFSNHRDGRREENTDSKEERRSPRRRRSSDSEDGHKERRGGRPDSSSPKRGGRSGSEDSRKEGLAGRSRRLERERSPSHGESSEEDRARERRIADKRKEGKESSCKSNPQHEERSRRDGKADPGRRGTDRSTRERGVDTRRRSRSRSRDRAGGGVKGTDAERRHRSRELDYRSERNDGDRRRGDRRQEAPLEKSRDRGDRRHGERSSRRDRSRSQEGARRKMRNGSAKEKAKEPAIDYAELIRGYENMNAVEKLKARTKYALSQTVVKDSARGIATEWERFDFDTTAPLDEDAQQDFYGDDTKAADDASHLRNAGSTFGVTKAQAVREAEKQAAHDAAIFGRPMERSGDEPPGTNTLVKAPETAAGGSEEDEEDRPVLVMEEAQAEEQERDGPNEVLAKPAVPSWKEKALKAQQARREAAKV